jgi:hypothetical protein
MYFIHFLRPVWCRRLRLGAIEVYPEADLPDGSYPRQGKDPLMQRLSMERGGFETADLLGCEARNLEERFKCVVPSLPEEAFLRLRLIGAAGVGRASGG